MKNAIIVSNSTATEIFCEKKVIKAKVLEDAGLIWMTDGHGGAWLTPLGNPIVEEYNMISPQKKKGKK